MRNQFASQIVECATQNPNVMLLTGDHGYALFSQFIETCPDQFLNCGVAEQNMVCVAAGLSETGFIPFVYALAAFIPARALEQIKLSVAHPNRKVIFFGDGAGFVYGQLGTSHYGLEDIALLRAVPSMQIFSPSTSEEMRWSIDQAMAYDGPSYIRIGRADQNTEVVTQTPDNMGLRCIQTGCAAPGPKIAVLATGSMVQEALDLTIDAPCVTDVFSVTQIKPAPKALDEVDWQQYDAIITLEEHMAAGGMGSMLAQVITARTPIRFKIIGAKDIYPEACGDYTYLKEVFGLTGHALKERVSAFLKGGLDDRIT